MNYQEALKQADSIKESFLAKYPKKSVLTAELFDIISEMLSVDYAIAPGGKKLRVFKGNMLSLLTYALKNGGHKNYMLDLINVFRDSVISKYLSQSFGNKSDDLTAIINRLYYRLFAWQAFEDCEWRRIEEIEKILC